MMPLLAILFLSGCATAPTVYHYSWGNIVKGNQVQMHKFCWSKGATTDDGSLIVVGQDYLGCYDQYANDIYIEDTCRGAEALPHELAHEDGHDDPEKDGYGW